MDRTADYCCGFARAAAAGAPIGDGLKIYRLDDGTPVCYRCIRVALKIADEQLELERQRRQRYGGWHG